jgi:preprotein translocase subunit SecG
MLYYVIIALHVLVCILLVLVVLLQSGKGADLAGAFGGGSTQTAFGSRGPASFLTRVTTVGAVIFMLTSLGLSMMNDSRTTENRSVLDGLATTPALEPDANVTPALTPAQIEEQIRKIQERQHDAPADDATPESTPFE